MTAPPLKAVIQCWKLRAISTIGRSRDRPSIEGSTVIVLCDCEGETSGGHVTAPPLKADGQRGALSHVASSGGHVTAPPLKG